MKAELAEIRRGWAILHALDDLLHVVRPRRLRPRLHELHRAPADVEYAPRVAADRGDLHRRELDAVGRDDVRRARREPVLGALEARADDLLQLRGRVGLEVDACHA